MTIKRFQLSAEQKTRLLELAAEEEATIEDAQLADAELRREEHVLEGQIKDHVGTERSEDHTTEEHAEYMWQKINQRLSEPAPVSMVEEDEIPAAIEGYSKVKRRVFLAAAAALFAGIYLFQTRRPASLGDGGIVSKDGLTVGSAITCEGLPMSQQRGQLSGDGLTYQGLLNETMVIQLTCSGAVWVHIAVQNLADSSIEFYPNLRISATDDALIMQGESEPLRLDLKSDLRIGLYVSDEAVEQVADDVTAIVEMSELGTEPIVWQDIWTVKADSEGGSSQ